MWRDTVLAMGTLYTVMQITHKRRARKVKIQHVQADREIFYAYCGNTAVAGLRVGAAISNMSHSNKGGSTTVKRARFTGKGSRSTAVLPQYA
jgi:hypothetical protein